MTIVTTTYFTGLNGLRAIAALSVVFSHITLSLNLFGLDPFVFGKYTDGNPKATLLAGFGVSIFFSISGFLITYLLVKEKSLQTINIKKFYTRRILRIWPLYFIYLTLVVISLNYYEVTFEKSSLLFYIFLSANIPFIFGGVIEYLGHYWSLGVEEQFYLFWPIIIKYSKNVIRLSIILCISLVVLKLLIYSLSKKNEGLIPIYEIIHVTRFQCMLIGAIGGILFYKKNQLFLSIAKHRFIQIVSWFIVILIAINKFHLISVLDNEFVSIIAVFLILGQIENNKKIINLENIPLDFLGKLSFGIYVVHPLIIFFTSKFIQFKTDEKFNYIIVFMVVFTLTILVSFISYKFIEKPILRFKKKFEVISSKSSMNS